MRDHISGRFRQQVRFLRQQFLQSEDLPLSNVLSRQVIAQAMETIETCWRDRIYSPLVTLWVFLGQVLSHDHSCRAAVARLIAHRLSHDERACSAETGAYCQARKRLPEKFFSTAARLTGQKLDDGCQEEWLWNKRRVLVYDGPTVSMPDTPQNQEAYPQPPQQKTGIGIPLARIAAFFSLSSGAVVEFAICGYSGKGNSELGMLRKLWRILRSGDVMLVDRYMCSWNEILMLQQEGVHCVTRLNVQRTADFRRGKRLGKGDHVVRWPKPQNIRSVDRATLKTLPDYLTVRETRVRVKQPGFRSRTIIVVSTMLQAVDATPDELAELYRARWSAEVCLRSLKETLQMDVLRGRTPEMVHKEIWTHILAYNLIRTIIAQAACKHVAKPLYISFKGALQTLEAFQPLLATTGQRCAKLRKNLCEQLLDAIATHGVGNRPNRFEPRVLKRRPKKYDRMMKPRNQLKRNILKGLVDN